MSYNTINFGANLAIRKLFFSATGSKIKNKLGDSHIGSVGQPAPVEGGTYQRDLR